MDPLANICEQIELATKIADMGSFGPPDPDDATRLAELVIALDKWRKDGGWDPYKPSSRMTLT